MGSSSITFKVMLYKSDLSRIFIKVSLRSFIYKGKF